MSLARLEWSTAGADRRFRLLINYYHGCAPYGQFFGTSWRWSVLGSMRHSDHLECWLPVISDSVQIGVYPQGRDLSFLTVLRSASVELV